MTEHYFSEYLMPFAILFIMFGIGLNLKVSDFAHCLQQPKAVIVGLTLQLIVLPGIAFLINLIPLLSPYEKAGLVLIAICPGGTTSNLITFLMRGRVALSVTLTTINSFIILISVPYLLKLAMLVYFGRDVQFEMPLYLITRDVFITILVPVLVGMAVYYFFPDLVRRLKRPMRYLMPGLLLVIFCGVVFIENDGPDLKASLDVIPLALLLNIAGTFIGYFVSRVSGILEKGAFTIAIEVGLQNSALAIFISSSVINIPEMSLVAVVYGSFSFFTTLLWAWMIKRFFVKE